MTSGYKAAIFDMDGTLLDSMRYWRLGCVEYLLAHQLPVPDSLLPDIFYISSHKQVRRVIDEFGLDIDYDKAINDIYIHMREHYARDVRLKPHAREFVESLLNKGIRCCVATGTPKESAIIGIKAQGMSDLFEFIFDESDAGTSKHDVVYFEKVAERLGLPLSDCVLFEDAAYSIRTAKKTPLSVIAIEDITARNEKDVIMRIADRYISDYGELL